MRKTITNIDNYIKFCDVETFKCSDKRKLES